MSIHYTLIIKKSTRFHIMGEKSGLGGGEAAMSPCYPTRQRLFVEQYLGGSSGSAVDAARRAGCPWTEQMIRKMLRNVEKRGVQAARLALVPGGRGSKLSYRSHRAEHSGKRDRTGSSHTCLRLIAAGRKREEALLSGDTKTAPPGDTKTAPPGDTKTAPPGDTKTAPLLDTC